MLLDLHPKIALDRKFCDPVCFTSVLGTVADMNPLEIAILATCLLILGFSIWQTRVLGLVIRNSAKELDFSLAEALKNVVSELPIGDFEPPNPFQQVLAQILQEKMAPPIVAKEIQRDESGKFS